MNTSDTNFEPLPARAGTVILVRWRGMLWDKCTLRKTTCCIYCGKSLPPKTAAWRPVTYGIHRMHRLCCFPWDADKLEPQNVENQAP